MKSECDRVDLSIVVVSWNVDEYLCQCLHSLRAHVDRELKYEIIVVDNHSNDNTVSMLESDFPEVKLIRNQKNLGFARANNQGLKISLGKYVLLLNPDTQLEEGCISTLISFLQRHEKVGVVGPRILNPDGTPQASGVNFPSLTNSLLGYFGIKKEGTGAYYLHANQPTAVNAVVGACLLVKRKVIDQVGELDEDYFIYVEEADWCYRIGQAGWLIFYIPSAVIIHHGGQSAALVPTETYIALRKSQILFLLKHRSRFQAILLSLCYATSSGIKALTGEKKKKQTYRQAASEFLSIVSDLLSDQSKH